MWGFKVRRPSLRTMEDSLEEAFSSVSVLLEDSKDLDSKSRSVDSLALEGASDSHKSTFGPEKGESQKNSDPLVSKPSGYSASPKHTPESSDLSPLKDMKSHNNDDPKRSCLKSSSSNLDSASLIASLDKNKPKTKPEARPPRSSLASTKSKSFSSRSPDIRASFMAFTPEDAEPKPIEAGGSATTTRPWMMKNAASNSNGKTTNGSQDGKTSKSAITSNGNSSIPIRVSAIASSNGRTNNVSINGNSNGNNSSASSIHDNGAKTSNSFYSSYDKSLNSAVTDKSKTSPNDNSNASANGKPLNAPANGKIVNSTNGIFVPAKKTGDLAYAKSEDDLSSPNLVAKIIPEENRFTSSCTITLVHR